MRVVDLVAPEITLNGDAQINHQIGETYVDAGAILSDNYDDDVSLLPGSVNVDTAGNYTLAFVASGELAQSGCRGYQDHRGG